MLEIRLLGQFEVRWDGESVPLPSRPAQSLLAYLVLNPGTAHRREKLAGLLAPEATEANARRNLRQALWQIKKALEAGGPDYLVVDNLSIGFEANADCWLDAAVLEQKAGEATSAAELAAAASVYRGELLPGFYDEWAVLERERLQAVFEHKMDLLLERLVAEARWPEVLEWGERWIALGHTPEPAYRGLMRAYSELGDAASAASSYRRGVEALQRDLGVEPSAQTRALHARLASGGPPAELPAQDEGRSVAQRHNLPLQLTSFIGREREIEEVQRLLSGSRLVTLTGAGGSGKTRLAIKVATGMVETFKEGAWLVELAGLADPALVPQAVASVLGVHEMPPQPLSESLVSYLREKHLLVVLDNCEHLIQACAQLSERLLSACPDLKIMTTSREALGILGEAARQVPTLSLPDPRQALPVESLLQFQAIRLFAERAQAVNQSFSLSPQNASAVQEICQRLDGIPLAIELAAARVKMLSVEQIAARLDDRFNLLTSGSRTALPRHQTLRAMIDWSHDLLTEQERAVFRRLSVFAGGWTLEAAEHVMSDGQSQLTASAGLDFLTQLVNKSLVVAERTPADEARYHLLETIREYARDKLQAADGAEQAHERHLDYFLHLAETAEPRLRGADQEVWVKRLDAEHDNLRSALAWTLNSGEASAEAGLRMAGALGWFWLIRSHFSEGRGWLKRVLALAQSAEVSGRSAFAKARAKARDSVGELAFSQGDYAEARALQQESVTIFRNLGDPVRLGNALNTWGRIVLFQGDLAAARAAGVEAVAIFRELRDPSGLGRALTVLGLTELSCGDYAAARIVFEESLATLSATGEKHPLSLALTGLGRVALHQGDFVAARTRFEAALTIRREFNDKFLVAHSLNYLGTLARHERDHRRAAALHRESLILFQEIGSRHGIALCLAAFAGVTAGEAHPEPSSSRSDSLRRAARLAGAAEGLLDSIGAVMALGDPVDHARIVAAVRADLGEADFNVAGAEGRAMPIEEAVAYALEGAAQA